MRYPSGPAVPFKSSGRAVDVEWSKFLGRGDAGVLAVSEFAKLSLQVETAGEALTLTVYGRIHELANEVQVGDPLAVEAASVVQASFNIEVFKLIRVVQNGAASLGPHRLFLALT